MIKTLRILEKLVQKVAIKYAKNTNAVSPPTTAKPQKLSTSPSAPISNTTSIAPNTQSQQVSSDIADVVPKSRIQETLQLKEGYKKPSKHLNTVLNNFGTFFATTGKGEKPHEDTIHALRYLDSHGLLEQGVLPGLSSAKLSQSFLGDVANQYNARVKAEQDAIQEKINALKPDSKKRAKLESSLTNIKPKIVGMATRVLKGLLPSLHDLVGFKDGKQYPSDAKLEKDPELNRPPIERTGALKDAKGILNNPNKSITSVKDALAVDKDLLSSGGRSPVHQAGVLRWLKNGFMDGIVRPLMGSKNLEIQNEALYRKGGANEVLEKLVRDKKITPEQRTHAAAALLFLGQRDDVSHELSLMGEKYLDSDGNFKENYDPGDLWYDDNMLQTDWGIAHVVNHLHGKTVIPIDPETGFPVMQDGIQNPHLSAFKALMAPTSFGLKPGANLKTSFEIYKQAIKAWKEDGSNPNKSVFSYIDTKRQSSPEEEKVLIAENTFYERCKALSNSMQLLDKNAFNRINQLYAQGKEDQALDEQKNWLRKTFNSNPKLLLGSDGKPLSTYDQDDAGNWGEERKLNLSGSGKDDLDIIMQGALKPPKVSQLSRHYKSDINAQRKLNPWVEHVLGGKLNNPKQILQSIENLELSENDLKKDWTTRGGSINSMLRFVKSYAAEHGDQGLHDFLQKNHTLDDIQNLWIKHSLEKDANGKTIFDHNPEDFESYKKKSRNKFLNAVPKSMRKSVIDGAPIKGAYIFGPKGGNFWQDISYQGGNPTKDLWFTRAALFVLGGMTSKSGKLVDTPPTVLREAFDLANNFVANSLGLSSKQVQAIWWYHKKRLDTMMGVKTAGNENYVDAAEQEAKGVNNALEKPKINRNATTGSAANQRSQNAKSQIVRTTPIQNTTSVASLFKLRNPKKSKFSRALSILRQEHPIRYAQFTPVNGGMQSAPVSDRTNVPFGNAVAKVNTGKNIAHAQLNDQVAQKAGVRTTSSTAIGDWPNGSEQSTMHTADSMTEPERMRYLAAWHGLASQKKSVLVFHPNPKGPDSLYHIDHPETDLGKLREQLNQFNLQYKTLVPGAKGTKVILFDPAKSNRSAIDQFATKNNLEVVENTGQGEILGHNGDWNSAGALPKSRQAYNNIIAQYEQNQNSTGSSNNSGGTPTPAKQTSTGETKKQLSKSGKAHKFNKARRILEGFLRAHNTPNKELPPVGDLLAPDLQGIKPEHMSKYQQLVPGAKWSDIEGAVSSLQQDPSLYADMTSESNRREMYCKEHARTVLHSSGVQKLLDSLVNQKLIPEHAQHLIQDAKDGDYFALEAISAELQHSIPALRSFSKAAEREYNKAGKAWDKMRSGVQKFGKKHHSAGQFRAGEHEVIMRGATYKKGQFAPQNDGKARFEKGSSKLGAIYSSINKFRGS